MLLGIFVLNNDFLGGKDNIALDALVYLSAHEDAFPL